MKKEQIVSYFYFLNGINLSKIEDKAIRSAVISNHMMMYRIVKEHEEDVKELQKKLFEGKESEIGALNDLRERFRNEVDEAKKADIVKKIVDEHASTLALEKEYTEALSTKMKEEKEITLKKVNQDDFVDACVSADINITPSDLIALENLFV